MVGQQNPHVMEVGCLASLTDLLGVGATTPLLLEEKGRIFSSSGLPFPPDMAMSCRIDFKK